MTDLRTLHIAYHAYITDVAGEHAADELTADRTDVELMRAIDRHCGWDVIAGYIDDAEPLTNGAAPAAAPPGDKTA